jgi:hypothetical protein
VERPRFEKRPNASGKPTGSRLLKDKEMNKEPDLINSDLDEDDTDDDDRGADLISLE